MRPAALEMEHGTGNREPWVPIAVISLWLWEDQMQTVIERVMRTYGMMINLTVTQQEQARERLEAFLRNKTGSDQQLAVQGLQFLRGSRSIKRRTICRINNAAKQVPCEESG
jgi:hypothetical protein